MTDRRSIPVHLRCGLVMRRLMQPFLLPRLTDIRMSVRLKAVIAAGRLPCQNFDSNIAIIEPYIAAMTMQLARRKAAREPG